jgi:hypothetical protein
MQPLQPIYKGSVRRERFVLCNFLHHGKNVSLIGQNQKISNLFFNSALCFVEVSWGYVA